MRNISDLQIQARALRPITLRLSRTLYTVLFGIFIPMDIAGGIFVLPSEPIFGSLAVIVISLALLAGFRMMSPGATFLAIDRRGVTQCINFYSKSVRWSEIQKIHIGWYITDLAEIPWNRQVFIAYEREGRTTEMAIFSHMFGINVEQLISLLAPFHDQATKRKLGDFRIFEGGAACAPSLN